MDNIDSSSSIRSATIVFSIAAFIGNFGLAVTGFGMAIIFIFVYTIADLANLMECNKCDLRDAVFYQTLALGASIPLLLYDRRNILKIHFSKELMLTFIPSTIVGTPLGNYSQGHLPSDALRVIVGALITVVVCYEIYKLIRGKVILAKKSEPIDEDQGEEYQVGQDSNYEGRSKTLIRGIVILPKESELVNEEDEENQIEQDSNSGARSKTQISLDGIGKEETTNDVQIGDGSKTQIAMKEMGGNPLKLSSLESEKVNNSSDNDLELSSEESSTTDEKKIDVHVDFIQSDDNAKLVEEDDEDRNDINETLPTGRKLRVWGSMLGLLSGFLGGLMGVRGPPLMIFFLIFSYPKDVVRANAVLILLVNAGIRIGYYIVEDLTGTRVDWFDIEYLYLYICVAIFGVIGVPIGNYVGSKINQQQFKLIMAFLLLFSGLSNLVKGSINLAT